MPSPTADPALETFTIPQLAKRWAVSDSHLYRLARRGELPGAFQLGAAVRISKAALLAWEAKLVESAEANAIARTSTPEGG